MKTFRIRVEWTTPSESPATMEATIEAKNRASAEKKAKTMAEGVGPLKQRTKPTISIEEV